MNGRVRSLLLATLGVVAPNAPCVGGGLTGRIVVEGEAPAQRPLPPGRDACCRAAGPIDESVVVGPDGGLANVLVSVEPRRGEAIPPSDGAPRGAAVLTNRGCAFTPRVLVARVGQTLELANSDPTMHNVDVEFVRNRPANVVVEPGGARRFDLVRAERRPAAVRCNVHPFMRAWVAVRDDPHAAVTGADGRFALGELPSGEWRLRFWREGAPVIGLPLVDGASTDERGEAVLEVPDGGLDLGELRVAAESLR